MTGVRVSLSDTKVTQFVEDALAEVSFGEWLKRRRGAMGWTQKQFAQQINCSTSALRKIEAEERRPSAQMVEQLANIFNLPTGERESFLKFARGDWKAATLGVNEEIPWQVSDSSKPGIHLATFLFTDIEGSTKLWESQPEKMKVALQRHHAILQEAITSNGGTVFQIVGDAFCAVFPTAPSAILAAETAQRLLHQESWDLILPIRVRMGIHTGEAEQTSNTPSAGGYASNQTLNRVARILNAAHGGQVLLSLVTKELVQDALSPNTELRDMGEHQLKSLVRLEHLFQLNVADLPSDFPPLNTLNRPHQNLPVQLTSFVGREKELADILRLLEDTRMVTLIGPGGTGKTRLSIQTASEMLDQYPDGVWFVELAPILDPLLVPRTTAIAIGLRYESQHPVMDMLCDYLHEKKTLLILDNCEHLVDACARMADQILHAAPKTLILASSREALGIGGEVTYRVPSLRLPDLQHLPPIESLSQYEAVKLFIDRAMSAVPTFAVTLDNAPALAQVCHHLDGIPLAIELAAAKIRVLSLVQIAERLNDRFRLLTGGSRTVLERHQTLRAAIDWSYNLLSPKEQVLFQKLSVFVGGWTLEAAEAVCEGGSVQNEEVLNLLEQLINKSLVITEEAGHEARYHMLETILQYAREKLAESGESEVMRERHTSWFVELAERAEPKLRGHGQIEWLERVEQELDNMRSALEWSLHNNFDLGLRITSALMRFWPLRGHEIDCLQYLEKVLRAGPLAPSSLHAKALACASWGTMSPMMKGKMIAFAEAGAAMAREISEMESLALSLGTSALALNWQGDNDRSLQLCEEGLRICEEVGTLWVKQIIVGVVGMASQGLGDYERSRAAYLESLALSRESGDVDFSHWALANLAGLSWEQGEFEQALNYHQESLSLVQELKNKSAQASILQLMGEINIILGRYLQAKTLLEESIAIERDIGFAWEPGRALDRLGRIARLQGDYEQARHLYTEGLRLAKKYNSHNWLAWCLVGLAELAALSNQPKKAARLLGKADAIPEHNVGLYPSDHLELEQISGTIRAKLDEAIFKAEYQTGKQISTDEAIAYALKEATDD